jgi:heptosyltransferase-2
MSRSLIVAPQWIGDAVMSQPLISRLAARGESLSVGALPWVAPVYRAMPEVDEVLVFPFQHGRLDWSARRELARRLRGRFKAAYVLPNSIKSALVPWLARIPRRVGYHGEGRWLLLTERKPNPGGRPPMVAYYATLAGERARTDERPLLRIAPRLVEDAAHDAGLEAGSYWAFAPGAEYGPAKRWPTAHYASLARALHARHRLPIALLGSPKEAGLCDEIAALAPGTCQVLAGRTSLDNAMALIAGARALVSNDSGLMHVAAALQVPQVALFGSTSPEHTPPLNPRARVLWLKDELKLDCMPCFDRECRFNHYRCLRDLPPQRVDAALHSLFERA